MKTKMLLLLLLLIPGCNQPDKPLSETEKIVPVENTLKSVSLVYDSLKSDPFEMLSILKQINSLIDSIGYPDAGYELWMVQGDSTKGFRFMVEGHWPDKAIYDTIHNNKLIKALGTDLGNKFWKGKKSISYNRFNLVKR